MAGTQHVGKVMAVLSAILGILFFSAYMNGGYETPCPSTTTTKPHAETYKKVNGKCTIESCETGYTIQGDSCVPEVLDENGDNDVDEINEIEIVG